MNKVFKSAILLFLLAAFVGCSNLSNPIVDDGSSTEDTENSVCEDCKGNSQLLAIVPTSTSYEIYPNQLVQTISGNCNDGQFPTSYITWQMTNDSNQVIVKNSGSASVYTGQSTIVNGQDIEGIYFCRQGRFVMDVEMPGVVSTAGTGGLGGNTFTVKAFIFGIDEQGGVHQAAISRNYRLVPKN